MAEEFPSGAVLGEGVPKEQIGTFEEHGRRLFAAAKQRFYRDSRTGVGRTGGHVLNSARYISKEGELVTVLDSASEVEAEESIAGSISVTIETPLPWSLEFPNAYIRETFVFTPFTQPDTYDYSLGVNEYTLDGDPIIQGHTMEDVRAAYPKTMKPLQQECTPEHFTDQMLTMVQLQPGDEVGCEPNPYYQIYRG